MEWTRVSVFLGAILCCTGWVSAQVASDAGANGSETDEANETLREKRLQKMVELVSGLEIVSEGDDQPLRVNVSPLLRYSNPNRGRYNDGAMFVLSDASSRPRVMVACSIRGPGQTFVEVVSVSDKIVSAKIERFGAWSPPLGGSGPRVALLQPPVGNLPARRLLAMRQIARTVTFEFRNKDWTEARLLSQPIHRFAAPDAGLSDGAIFGYAESNDPEAVLVVWLDASDPDKPTWHWLAAASTSLPLRCRESGMPRWNKGGYWSSPRTAASPYIEFSRGQIPELVPSVQKEK